MFGAKYLIVPVPRPDGEMARVWFDASFKLLRLVDDATFNRLQAITKSRVTLLIGMLAPAAVAIAYLLLFVAEGQEFIVYVIFGVVLIDLTSRAVFTISERNTIARMPPHPVPEDVAAELREAHAHRNLAALQTAAGPLVAKALEAKPAK